MPKIIISYRRSDSDAIAGRIRDRLAAHYGERSIFMDIDNIPFGADFREHIQNAIVQNDLLLAVVGPQWVGQSEGGRRRIGEELDLVRIEVETAMKQGIPVVPVLVNGATMPRPEELPEALRDFSFRNAATVDSGRDFHQHLDRLIRSLDKLVKAKPRLRIPAPLLYGVAGVAIAGGLAAGLVYWVNNSPGAPPAATQQTKAANPATTTIVEFAELKVGRDPVAARPYLHEFGISVEKPNPESSEMVIMNNRGLYEGGSVRPTTSQNFLTQINTGNVVASYLLTFANPPDAFSFTRPALYAATSSGITHPGWSAVALDARGGQLSAQSEGLIRSRSTVQAQTYTFRAPGFDRIAAIRFESDPRLDGKPFAAFSTLLIERLTLVRDGGAALPRR